MLTEIVQDYTNGQFVNNFLRQYEYNSYNLLEEFTWNDWDGTQFETEQGFYYYYELYDPASTGNIVMQNASLQVYPNPATNTISIQSFTEQKSVFGVTIYDATGKSVRHWNEPPTSMYSKQVDVSGLASGNYFLRIDNQPQETVKFTIIK